MAINPISYTERITRSFLKYQLTAYPFSDPRLHEQMRNLLNLDVVRQTPLLKGPYISLSRVFRKGSAIDEMIDEGIFHPHMKQIIGASITQLYGHQATALRAIHEGKTTLISTGTGSGKTECFLYPMISKALELRDEGAPVGVSAVIVYPMNALAEDQLDRLRGLLAGSGITFGMYVGKTPEYEREVTGYRLQPGSSQADYKKAIKRYREQGRPDAIHPAEEICSREMMRTSGKQPRILLTNVKQLELLLTRQVDVELFNNARLDYLVFDEAHTFSGVQGAETACLLRRLRTFCGLDEQATVNIATSATIVDSRDPDAGRRFASRFFGVSPEQVECVHEEYESESWEEKRHLPNEPTGDLIELLKKTLAAVDLDNGDSEVRSIYEQLSGWSLQDGAWREALAAALIKNELAFQIGEVIKKPQPIDCITEELSNRVGRSVSEEELLCYLAMGAAALSNGRPVFRPVVHAFIRGIPGAVVTFPGDDNEPKLWLSSEDESAAEDLKVQLWHAPIYACTTCGQHYYVNWLKDYHFVGERPDGGQLDENGQCYWEPLNKDHGGKRAILVDRIISREADEELEDENWSAVLYLCKHCGCAHREEKERCQNCGISSPMVKLYAVRSKQKSEGYLSSCISCTSKGKRMGRHYREPMREVRATTVSDVHVLTQDMVHHAERQRLLLFADNRQDAAFQAGWMKDHARRFRLRRLIADTMKDNALTLEEMVLKLDEELDTNDALSRALIPEVWRFISKEGSGGRHQEERRYLLRIQVLREIATPANDQRGLEPWGRLKVHYSGIDTGSRFVQEWSRKIGLPPDDLKNGIETLLDQLRRQRLLYDPFKEIFTRFWSEGDREVQLGYMPIPPGPRGMKLTIEVGDDKRYVQTWLSNRLTLVQQIAQKWGLEKEDIPDFLQSLWDYLSSDTLGVFIPVTLKSQKGKALPNCSGVYQINSTKLLLSENHGYYRCKNCRRKVSRRAPNNLCMAWHCKGELEFVAEDPDSYNLQLLDEGYSMLRPEEHTAMVPQAQRERIENLFKGTSDAVNTLVCTPTLELGVDIGALDAILLRNVPPLPANYWQRTGRAGRRHRMAVTTCYARPTSHDRAYFVEPLKMLEGKVDPPAFNMRNNVMVAKHVHASVITRLFQLAYGDSAISVEEKERLQQVLTQMLPRRINNYLFDHAGKINVNPFDVTPLKIIIDEYHDELLSYVKKAFQQGWPDDDQEVTTAEALSECINGMAGELSIVLKRLHKRLKWAHAEIQRLNLIRTQYGTLDNEDEAHFRRCDQMVKKLKGVQTRSRREAEGIDEINTYGVLSAEGFLPGYGLDSGSVVGMAEVPPWLQGSMDFSLPRPVSVALREYVPGNRIYANGHRFVARRFQLDMEQERSEFPLFEVNIEREALIETSLGCSNSSMSSVTLPATSVCDVALVHQSQISDEEETRFQMPVSVFGREKNRHNGGLSLTWGSKELKLRHGVHYRMVNIGSSNLIQEKQQLGYPVCSICGQSVSPMSSDRQIEHFMNSHEERCGRKPGMLGFYADIVADSLTLPSCKDRMEAYSLLEALRMGAAHILDMHLEDLQLLVIGYVDRDEVDGIIWDPMPGGSGLLDQIRDNFAAVIDAALRITKECPSLCDYSCIDCLQTFRNGFYHKHLNRHVAIELLEELGGKLEVGYEIVPQHPSSQQPGDEQPVNAAELKLQKMLEAAGFTSGQFQQQIKFKQPITLDYQIGSTTPDVFFESDEEDDDENGICIYLDGMSAHLHDDPETARRDQEIRSWLRNNGYHVLEITAVELDDRNAMIRHFRKLAKYLSGKDLADRVKQNSDEWFGEIES